MLQCSGSCWTLWQRSLVMHFCRSNHKICGICGYKTLHLPMRRMIRGVLRLKGLLAPMNWLGCQWLSSCTILGTRPLFELVAYDFLPQNTSCGSPSSQICQGFWSLWHPSYPDFISPTFRMVGLKPAWTQLSGFSMILIFWFPKVFGNQIFKFKIFVLSCVSSGWWDLNSSWQSPLASSSSML